LVWFGRFGGVWFGRFFQLFSAVFMVGQGFDSRRGWRLERHGWGFKQFVADKWRARMIEIDMLVATERAQIPLQLHQRFAVRTDLSEPGMAMGAQNPARINGARAAGTGRPFLNFLQQRLFL
jgi:hypothetical protein